MRPGCPLPVLPEGGVAESDVALPDCIILSKEYDVEVRSPEEGEMDERVIALP